MRAAVSLLFAHGMRAGDAFVSAHHPLDGTTWRRTDAAWRSPGEGLGHDRPADGHRAGDVLVVRTCPTKADQAGRSYGDDLFYAAP